MTLRQIELVGVRVLCKMAESKMAEFKMEEFKMVAIIKLIRLNKFESESEWRKSVFEWIWEKMTRCLNLRWQCLNPTWQNSRWLPSSSSVRMNEWSSFLCKMAESKMTANHQVKITMNNFESDWISCSQSFVQNGWIPDGRIQDCCHHQVKWEWMSLSQIELVWVRVRMEWECFWVNLREE